MVPDLVFEIGLALHQVGLHVEHEVPCQDGVDVARMVNGNQLQQVFGLFYYFYQLSHLYIVPKPKSYILKEHGLWVRLNDVVHHVHRIFWLFLLVREELSEPDVFTTVNYNQVRVVNLGINRIWSLPLEKHKFINDVFILAVVKKLARLSLLDGSNQPQFSVKLLLFLFQNLSQAVLGVSREIDHLGKALSLYNVLAWNGKKFDTHEPALHIGYLIIWVLWVNFFNIWLW